MDAFEINRDAPRPDGLPVAAPRAAAPRLAAMLFTMTLVTGGQAHAAPADDVLAADRAFAAYAKQHGTEAAFVEYATADAVLFVARVGPVRGPAAIGKVYATGPKILLEWTPEFAEVAASGDLAWSWGYGRWTVLDGSNTSGTTNYVTVWRKQPDGRWKWAADLGVPAPAKGASPAP